jgi:hypothetical protein
MIKICKSVFILLCVLALWVSCKKGDYLTDSGIHEAITPLSTYDYLQQHSWHFFDTTILVIDHYNLKDEVNQVPTFFAFTDYSIAAFMADRRNEKQQVSATADYTLDSLYKYMTVDSIRQYFFDQEIRMGDMPVNEVKAYTSESNTTMGVFRELQVANDYTVRTNAPTYLLYLVKVRGVMDVPGVIYPPTEVDTRVRCQTTGILTSNGAKTLHVLNNQHRFVRF